MEHFKKDEMGLLKIPPIHIWTCKNLLKNPLEMVYFMPRILK